MSDLYIAITEHQHFPLLLDRDHHLAAYVAARIADDLQISPGQVIDAAQTYLDRVRHSAP